MACIKSTARSALVAFAPDAPYLAAGTMAGAVDLSFSSSANLEIFELDFQSDSAELPLVGSSPSAERFNRLAWGRPVPTSDEFPLGIVAGGLGDGSISIWNPQKLIRKSAPCGAEDQDVAFVARLEKHTGPVRGLDFNPHSSLLASGADEGELCIWDLANPLEPIIFPSLKSSGSGAQTEVSFVSWNPKFQHILASTSYNGITVVWDLKQQKPVTRLSDSNKTRCSVLQWNPDISTQFIVASDDDSSPALKVWDVRKTISPLREFVGHTKGVISMSWCPYDATYLLTCAKDNRTICWDTTRGEIVCELPASTNWNFDIHWYPRIPGVISASSFDVKVGIYNLEACNRVVEGEFGAPARLKAPKWLKRPVGTSFGFGGKLVSFHSIPGVPSTGSEIYVHNLVTEHGLVSRSTEFEAAIQDGEKASLRVLCDKKSDDSVSEDDKETWGFLKVMFEEEGTARTKLLTHLGFSVPNEGSEGALDELSQKLSKTMALDGKALYEGGDTSAFTIDNGEDFFNNLQPSDDNFAIEDSIVPNNEQIKKEAEEHRENSDSSIDERIQHALVVGDYNEAVLQCISANRMADALVIAHVGGPSLWETTRDQYLKNSLSPYLKVVSAMVNNDLMRLVKTRPLNLWKETLALLCTFARKEEWTVLCDTLASRLMTGGNTLAATLCYISAGNIDRTVEIWSHSLSSEYDGRSYVELLQDLMEKTIVLALATGQKRFSTSLSKLVENYAELLASQGLLTTAMEYLKLLGSEESSHELAILSDRIAFSAADKEIPQSLQYENSMPQPAYGADVPSFGAVDSPQDYYKEKVHPQPLQNVSGGSYGESYQQPMSYYGGYQPVQQHVQVKPQFPEYMNPTPYQSAQPPAMFVPSQTHQAPQQNFTPPPGPAQPTHMSFTPSTPQTLRNVEQYHQPGLGTQLYQGAGNQTYQPGPTITPHHGIGSSPVGPVNNDQFPQPMVPSQAPKGFIPTNPGFVQRPGTSPAQPSSPTQSAQLPTIAPTAPTPTVQTVDTSNVSVALRPVITTLTRLFHETSEALGGARANPSKKREIEDNSRKIGALFFKLNSGDISPNAASKLGQLCQALDSGDFAGALHIQVVLTTSDWDECNFWLAALKRMIKTRQSVRI